ncbi:MAG: hypothetical protein ABS81_03465 [Pseudonocardia sp. SCN 72-86]|nr:MAG: hypothetical protein ABS81_03465 [Pseudonocardia sp. SCN 72-86]
MRLGKHLATGHALDDAEIIPTAITVDELLEERPDCDRDDVVRPAVAGPAMTIADAGPVPVVAGPRLGS